MGECWGVNVGVGRRGRWCERDEMYGRVVKMERCNMDRMRLILEAAPGRIDV